MSWNFNSNAGGGKKAEFTKFPTGITKIRILDNAPNIRWVHWMPQFNRSINCPGNKVCPICEIRQQQKANNENYSYNMSRRFAMNIYNFETKKVEIMEQGVNFFEDLRDLKGDLEDEGKELQNAVVKVRRRGTGKDDTSYRLDIEEYNPVNLEELKEEIIDLDEFLKPNEPNDILRLVNGESWDEVFSKEEGEKEPQDSEDERVEVR